MAFWGIEVKPGKPYTHLFDEERGRLHLSQATLGDGSSTKKSILQCKTGENDPIYLCSLLPDKIESCALNLEFEEEDEVIFSVQGPQSIFLSGFFIGESEEAIRDAMRDAYESDSYGEEISGTESDDASNYDSEEDFEGNFLDDDLDMYPSSPVPKSKVVIEEILDDDKPTANNESSKSGKKKKLSSTSANNNSEKQLVVKGSNGNQVLESEDEDGFPILTNDKNKFDASSIDQQKPNEVKDKRSGQEAKKNKTKDEASVRSLKRKVDSMVEDEEEARETVQPGSSPVVSGTDTKQKENKKKKKKVNDKEEAQLGDKGHQKQSTEKNSDADTNSARDEKKKKKNTKQGKEADATVDESVANKKETPKDKTKGKSAQVRTFQNGLVIEEVAMGRPEGKKASPGKKVSVHYIGKLKKNGAIFDSNVGRAPFKFRLGVGEVIKGWDVGVDGMRVGDKRRLTIPPAMGYGAKGAGKQIPPNSWLVFDVELVAVN